MPGGAMRADTLHTLVVLDLSWDGNGNRRAEVTAKCFSWFAAWLKGETEEWAADFIKQL